MSSKKETIEQIVDLLRSLVDDDEPQETPETKKTTRKKRTSKKAKTTKKKVLQQKTKFE